MKMFTYSNHIAANLDAVHVHAGNIVLYQPLKDLST